MAVLLSPALTATWLLKFFLPFLLLLLKPIMSTLVSFKLAISATAVFFIVVFGAASLANNLSWILQYKLEHSFLAMALNLCPLCRYTRYDRERKYVQYVRVDTRWAL